MNEIFKFKQHVAYICSEYTVNTFKLKFIYISYSKIFLFSIEDFLFLFMKNQVNYKMFPDQRTA